MLVLNFLPLIISVTSLIAPTAMEDNKSDLHQIKELFETTYLEVLCKNGDPQILRETFHPDFHMYILYNDEISVRTLDEWIFRLESNRGKFEKEQTWKFVNIDITGTIASVKLEIYSDGNIKYSDYFTLYKTGGEWKVMTKTFYMH